MEQGFSQVQRGDASGADALCFRLLDERHVRLVEQAYGIGVEGAGLVERFEHAEPHLIGGFGTDDGVRTTVIGEVESGAGCVSVQGWILHVSIVNAGIRRLFERGSLRDVVFSM